MDSVPFNEYPDSNDEPFGPLPLAAIHPGGKRVDFYY